MPSAHELVQSCTSIFTLPEIYFRVRDVVDDPDSTMDDLAAVLKLDPAISARLLRIVNSPMYGFSKQIDTITHAVNLLGTQAVSDLVTLATIGRTFSGMPVQLMDVPGSGAKACSVPSLPERLPRLAASTTASASSSKACCATSATSSCIRPSPEGPICAHRGGLPRQLTRRGGAVQYRMRLR